MPYTEEQVIETVPIVRHVLEQIAHKWSILILTFLCEEPKRFNAHKMQILDHYAKYPEDYGNGENADSILDKQEHYEAEK